MKSYTFEQKIIFPLAQVRAWEKLPDGNYRIHANRATVWENFRFENEKVPMIDFERYLSDSSDPIFEHIPNSPEEAKVMDGIKLWTDVGVYKADGYVFAEKASVFLDGKCLFEECKLSYAQENHYWMYLGGIVKALCDSGKPKEWAWNVVCHRAKEMWQYLGFSSLKDPTFDLDEDDDETPYVLMLGAVDCYTTQNGNFNNVLLFAFKADAENIGKTGAWFCG